jgi:uncharacterized protein YaeQ
MLHCRRRQIRRLQVSSSFLGRGNAASSFALKFVSLPARKAKHDSLLMAKGATIYKADLQIADMDRGYYKDHAVTLACHPSETEERMMIRLLAFVLHASEQLAFGSGVSTADEPALWEKDLTGAVKLWIEVGQPDVRDLRRASGRANRVVVICYSGRGANVWWNENKDELDRLQNLKILSIPQTESHALARLANRNMHLQCNIQDGALTFIEGEEMVQVAPVVLKDG